jgi:hypothetical protein
MARRQKGDVRDSDSSHLSEAEKELARSLLAKLAPDPATYQTYRVQVDTYMDLVQPLLGRDRQGYMVELRLRSSELFGGLEYLVVYVTDEWLLQIAPHCDAISSAMTWGQGTGEQAEQVPPFVFLPESKRRARNEAFRSVVEHEMVHANQAILGTFPTLPQDRLGVTLFDHFMQRTSAEYEAEFLQETRWPGEHHLQAKISLEHWCLLRGYSQALEGVFEVIAQLGYPPPEVECYLDTLVASLPAAFQGLGASEDVVAWFTGLLDQHLAIAMQQVLSRSPSVKENPGFRAAGWWLRPRLGI